MFLVPGIQAKGYCDETCRCNRFFQGKLVPDYNVTKTFKAFVAARNAQEIYGVNVPPWMMPFRIAELIVHKKFNMKGLDSKVGQNSNGLC